MVRDALRAPHHEGKKLSLRPLVVNSFRLAEHASLSPHPEEPRSGVSKDVATVRASWFETRFALLTMRGES
jgi:hypothetical protein